LSLAMNLSRVRLWASRNGRILYNQICFVQLGCLKHLVDLDLSVPSYHCARIYCCYGFGFAFVIFW
jgi:hypothetical protein